MRLKFLLPTLFGAVLLLHSGVSAAAGAEQHKRVVDGVTMYLGVMPAEIVRGHSPDHPESKMHGGTPAGSGVRHVVIAIFDAKTGARVTDVEVSASVGQRGMGATEKVLEPMTIAGTTTYGNYFPMTRSGPYRIRVEVRRPEGAHPIHAEFEYRHARD